MFEAYNQWLFGPVEDLLQLKTTGPKTHPDQYLQLSAIFKKTRVFKMPSGQYYR